jgi:hypothetical protein
LQTRLDTCRRKGQKRVSEFGSAAGQQLGSHGDELESELRRILSQSVNATLSLLLFVEFSSSIHVFHSMAQHVVDQTCELGRRGHDGDSWAAPGPEPSVLTRKRLPSPKIEDSHECLF